MPLLYGVVFSLLLISSSTHDQPPLTLGTVVDTHTGANGVPVMLLDIINSLSFEFSLLIEDSEEKSGRCLVTSIAEKATARNENIVCVNTEPTFTSQTVQTAHGKLITIDVFGSYESLPDRLIEELVKREKCVVIFPSLSLFVMNWGVSKFAQLMRKLKDCEQVRSVAGLIHSDVLLTEESLHAVEYMFDVVATVSPVREVELTASYYGQATCIRRKASGKIDTSEEYFTLSDDLTVDLVHASSSAAIKSLVVDDPAKNITSKLTFNLTLSSKERDAKNKLQLPYLKKENEKEEMLSKMNSSGKPLIKIGEDRQPSGGGKIYYHYDEADDFDEEDPDDDLDV